MWPMYVYYPSWLKPEILDFLPIRWYSLSYFVATLMSYFLMRLHIREHKLSISAEKTQELTLIVVLSLLLGGRIGSVLVYNFSWVYVYQPWLIFWPFSEQGTFVGFQGMSYHGAVVGIILGLWIYSKVKKTSFWFWVDLLSVSVPLGYTFGRLGNFANGELFGRVTAVPWGMIFPNAPSFSLEENRQWIESFLDKIQMELFPGQWLVNLPRHPSQLYEAFFEGIAIWMLLWVGLRNKRSFPGKLFSLYLISYGGARFCIEYFREPDAALGFVWNPSQSNDPLTPSLLQLSMGQVLCLGMILAGVVLFYIRKIQSKTQNTPSGWTS